LHFICALDFPTSFAAVSPALEFLAGEGARLPLPCWLSEFLLQVWVLNSGLGGIAGSSKLLCRDRARGEEESRSLFDGHGLARREVAFSPEPMTETTEDSPAAAEQPAPESSQPAPATPTAAVAPAATTAVVAPVATTAVVAPAGAGRGEGKRKRGRPRKYGPDGSLLRPLKATPISASVPDDAGGGQYTPAAAVGAVMKRGRGRPVGFISLAPPVPMAVTTAAPTPAVVVSAPAPQTQLGPLGTSALLPPHASDGHLNLIQYFLSP
jgi:hypothetical protein